MKILESRAISRHSEDMTLVLPDIVSAEQLSEQELKLELACALYARGKISKVAGAELAGIDFFAFQGALAERGIPLYTNDMLDEDVKAVRAVRGR